MNRFWKQALLAAIMGIVAAGAYAGVRSMESAKEVQARRQLAEQKILGMFADLKDTRSGPVYSALVKMQNERLADGLSLSDYDHLLEVLHADVDQLVLARAIGILIGQYRQGRLSPEQIETCKLEAKRLYGNGGWVARGFAFHWSGELKDLTAIPALTENVRTEVNQGARQKAELALLKLNALKSP